jgi:hypothetical protein
MYYSGLASGLRRAREDDLANALSHMLHHDKHAIEEDSDSDDVRTDLMIFTVDDICQLVEGGSKKFLLLIGDKVIDAAKYMGEHVRFTDVFSSLLYS